MKTKWKYASVAALVQPARLCALLAAVHLAVTASAAVAAPVWTNTAGGNWSDAANWSPNQVPGPTNLVSLSTPGTYTVTNDIATLRVAGLIVGGAGSGVQTFLLSSGGALNGALTVANGGTLTTVGHNAPLLNVGGSLTVDSGGVANLGAGFQVFSPCTNNGTINLTNGNLSIQNTGQTNGARGVLVNARGGTIGFWGNGGIEGAGGQDYLVNQGAITKEFGSASLVYIQMDQFVNAGAITAQSGTLGLNRATLAPSGSLDVALNSATDYGQISISGNAALAGTFGVQLNNGFVPVSSDQFPVLSYGSYSGAFTSFNLPATLAWRESISSNALTLVIGAAHAQNLIQNGDFSLGNTNFSSGYTYVAYDYSSYTQTPQVDQGDYTVGPYVPPSYGDWAPFQTVSGGSTRMLIANGAADASESVWEQMVVVQPSTTYAISFYLAEISTPTIVADIAVVLDGNQIGDATAPSVIDTWQQYSLSWSSGNSTNVLLALKDLQTSGPFNDFAIGNISMSVGTPPANTNPPVIVTQPTNQFVTAGNAVTFAVSATGAPPLSYYWQLEGTNLVGATNSSYTLAYALPTGPFQPPASYDVVVSNSLGSVTSQTAFLAVQTPPYILAQPQSQTVMSGSNAAFTVTAFGTPTPAYQWRFDGQPIQGAVSSNDTVLNVPFSASGVYDVVLTNAVGSVTSQAATLTVRDYTQPAIQVSGTLTVECIGPAGAPVTFAVTATDPYDPSPVLTVSPPSGSMFPIGFTSVECVASDRYGNTNAIRFPVQVLGQCDAGCISLTTPPDIRVVLTHGSSARVSFTATATNTCTGQAYPVSYSTYPGASFAPGTNLVTCVATRGGASVTSSFNVVVAVTTPPVISAPSVVKTYTQTTNAQGQPGAVVPFKVTATGVGNVPVSVTTSPPSCSFFGEGTTVVTVTAVDAFGNVSTTQFPVVVDAADSNLPGQCDPNWGFEDTGGLGCWTANGLPAKAAVGDLYAIGGSEFGVQLGSSIGGDYWQELPYPVGYKGSQWYCTLDFCQGNQNVGTLDSADFAITNGYITFLIGGSSDSVNLLVELLLAGSGGPITIGAQHYSAIYGATGSGRELMRRAWFDVNSFIGQHARVRINVKTPNGHLNVDDFRFQDLNPTNQTVTIGCNSYPALVQVGQGPDGEPYYYDWDSPIWGFADLHTHPMSCLAFGGKYFHGQPDGAVLDGNPQDAGDFTIGLSNCNPDHGGWGSDNPNGDYFRQLVVDQSDGGGNDPHYNGYTQNPSPGYPNFIEFNKWPVFSTLSHQQMWYDWMRRAYNGGERVIVACCVNNVLLGTITKGNGITDDLAVSDLQVQAMTSFAARHSDFMAIATDPFQLRNIVRSNMLAIVLGSELDDIGDLVQDDTVLQDAPDQHSMDAVSRAIQHLYDQGIRYIFTVHLADNKFGGTGSGSGNDLLNVASKLLNQGQAVQVEPADPQDNIQTWLHNITPSATVQSEIDAAAWTALMASVACPVCMAGIGDIAAQVLSYLAPLPPPPPGIGGAFVAGVLDFVALGIVDMDLCQNCALDALLTFVGVGNQSQVNNGNLVPWDGNYPMYPTCTLPGADGKLALNGVRNQKGLTGLGAFAVNEMMKRGIMLDIDHMSQRTITNVVDMALSVPGGYPLNSSHNGYREMGAGLNDENAHTPYQVAQIQQLGGLLGVGWEDAAGGFWCQDASSVLPQVYSSSKIDNNCAGTSKTWAQEYLYALEKLHGQGVAFGTDADGLVQFPGPRFGPQSAYGLISSVDTCESPWGPNDIERATQIAAQQNGVLYSSNVLLTTAAFWGRGVDPNVNTDVNQLAPNTAYTAEQAMFFVGLNIYFWESANTAQSWAGSSDAAQNEQAAIQAALSDDYPSSMFQGVVNTGPSTRYPGAFAYGMFAAQYGWNICPPFSDDPSKPCFLNINEVADQQYLGAAVYNSVIPPPGTPWKGSGGEATLQVLSDTAPGGLYDRFAALMKVWDDYQQAEHPPSTVQTVPLNPCQTDFKQWDINFEGVAHYGLIPDFLQDLHNVGLNSQDMSVLFRSAETFAQMWTKSLQTGCPLNQPQFTAPPQVINGPHGRVLAFSFTHANANVTVEESSDLRNSLAWQPANVSLVESNAVTTSVTVPLAANGSSAQFYRVSPSP